MYFLPSDAISTLKSRGGGDRLVPPRGLANVGGGDFEKVGAQMLKRLVSVGGIGSSDRVLDVGCGVGRVAVPLTGFLDGRGSYEGFDIVEREVRWCRKNITPRSPNFRFRVADVYNREYNPSGRAKNAAEYVFPFPDGEFDFVLLTSVFTHMLPDEIENYVAEISRVLKPGGRCFATFFLLNEESLSLIEAGESSLPLPSPFPTTSADTASRIETPRRPPSPSRRNM